ncbi:uncharacterized protein LOC115629784 [Scaptodrosophila lebanonensis]|uniref:Uncharacterized protein LOC115629784 n=1 Tax=Drosophila lebanonensis TaxID=7225 RepID=A0A6J2U400_DROLE|nr:uncharacterized protein LOC115629784 [Scaptodrosophila lebanonensis]
MLWLFVHFIVCVILSAILIFYDGESLSLPFSYHAQQYEYYVIAVTAGALVTLFGRVGAIHTANAAVDPKGLCKLESNIYKSLIEYFAVFFVIGPNDVERWTYSGIALLVIRMFHWLTERRIQVLHRATIIRPSFHITQVLYLSGLFLVNSCNLLSNVSTSLEPLDILFLFEYAILMCNLFHSDCKYVCELLERNCVDSWHRNPRIYLIIQLVFLMIRAALYIFCNWFLLTKVMFLWIYNIRSIWETFRNIWDTLNEYLSSQKIVTHINTTLSQVSFTDIRTQGRNCVICRDAMSIKDTRKMPCGHIYHAECLGVWFQYQQTCPTCQFEFLVETRQQNGVNNRPGTAERIASAIVAHLPPASIVRPMGNLQHSEQTEKSQCEHMAEEPVTLSTQKTPAERLEIVAKKVLAILELKNRQARRETAGVEPSINVPPELIEELGQEIVNLQISERGGIAEDEEIESNYTDLDDSSANSDIQQSVPATINFNPNTGPVNHLPANVPSATFTPMPPMYPSYYPFTTWSHVPPMIPPPPMLGQPGPPSQQIVVNMPPNTGFFITGGYPNVPIPYPNLAPNMPPMHTSQIFPTPNGFDSMSMHSVEEPSNPPMDSNNPNHQ